MICGFLCQSVPPKQSSVGIPNSIGEKYHHNELYSVHYFAFEKKKKQSARTRYFPGKNHLSQKQSARFASANLGTLQQTFTGTCQELGGVPTPEPPRCSRSGSG